MFDDTANFLADESATFENLIDNLNKEDDLSIIKNRQKILQQERMLHASSSNVKK